MERARMFSARRSRVAKTETNRSWSSALTLAKQRPRDAAMPVGGPSPTSLGHDATDRCAAYLSRFGGLWPDRCDGQNLLVEKLKHEAVSDFESEQLRAWMVNGYVKLVKAVSDEVIAELLGDADRFWHGSESRIRVEDGHLNYVAPTPALRDKPGCRLRDMYYFSEATRRAVFSPPIVRFLQLLFERDILAFQSLLFERGTQQGVHQDPAYVVVSSPLELVASWIALEDIQDDAGPLLYYEGSHRLPDFIFGERYKHWEVQRDGPAIEQEYRHSLEESARQRSLPLRRFVGARGDVLLWHANLAHGGATITNP